LMHFLICVKPTELAVHTSISFESCLRVDQTCAWVFSAFPLLVSAVPWRVQGHRAADSTIFGVWLFGKHLTPSPDPQLASSPFEPFRKRALRFS